jgi:hypothetical protein
MHEMCFPQPGREGHCEHERDVLVLEFPTRCIELDSLARVVTMASITGDIRCWCSFERALRGLKYQDPPRGGLRMAHRPLILIGNMVWSPGGMSEATRTKKGLFRPSKGGMVSNAARALKTRPKRIERTEMHVGREGASSFLTPFATDPGNKS